MRCILSDAVQGPRKSPCRRFLVDTNTFCWVASSAEIGLADGFLEGESKPREKVIIYRREATIFFISMNGIPRPFGFGISYP
jgi:hypothetical protein